MLQEGDLGIFWGNVRDMPAPVPPPGREPVLCGKQEFDGDVHFAQNNVEDIAQIHAKEFKVHDDNDPAPENILQGAPPIKDAGLVEGQTWGWNGIE
jgi:hypothetical protein